MSLFKQTERYRSAEFDQGEIIRHLEANKNSFVALAGNIDEQTRFGVCLALCILWINQKISRMKKKLKKREAGEQIKESSAEHRMEWGRQQFGEAVMIQKDLAKAWETWGHRLETTLKYGQGLGVPKPVLCVAEYGTPLNPDTVIVRTLPMNVPYILAYQWDGDAAHAIVCYRTKSRTILFDPNGGEIACPHNAIDHMWRDYWKDVIAFFGRGRPATYGLVSVGVDTQSQSNEQAAEDLAEALLAGIEFEDE